MTLQIRHLHIHGCQRHRVIVMTMEIGGIKPPMMMMVVPGDPILLAMHIVGRMVAIVFMMKRGARAMLMDVFLSMCVHHKHETGRRGFQATDKKICDSEQHYKDRREREERPVTPYGGDIPPSHAPA